jgi:transcriptional regulator with XRE-family HTH domain
MIRISAGQLRYQAAIRGWDQEAVAREAGVSAATVSRAMRGMPVRGLTALCLVQALRRRPPLPELIEMVASSDHGTVRIN